MLTTRVFPRAASTVPGLYWKWYARQARRCGLTSLYAIISFDCDTPEDAEAAAELDPALRRRGVRPIYAVPGIELRRNCAVYAALAKGGATFMNHGSLPHVECRQGRYWSVTFYHELTATGVVEDIERGHADVIEVTGRPPAGFRAPHFGLFQRPSQLALVYRTLHRMGYAYASTTMPLVAALRGPMATTAEGLIEFPLTGSFDRPLQILDSWSNIVSPENPVVRDTYGALLADTGRQLAAAVCPGILNFYVDPAHVRRAPAFLAALDAFAAAGIQFTDYETLIAMRDA